MKPLEIHETNQIITQKNLIERFIGMNNQIKKSVILVPKQNEENFRKIWDNEKCSGIAPTAEETLMGIPVIFPIEHSGWIAKNWREYDGIYIVYKERIVILNKKQLEEFCRIQLPTIGELEVCYDEYDPKYDDSDMSGSSNEDR